jgi:hypothetical protein
MLKEVSFLETVLYHKLNFNISQFRVGKESQVYTACEFKLEDKNIIFRTSKETPKKEGQFVTFWKRNKQGVTEPFADVDIMDYCVIHFKSGSKLGQFVFPKAVLIEKGILSSSKRRGKRGFRIYSIWDKTKNKQAISTQKWQLDYFFEINDHLDFNFVKKLYSN